MVRLQDIKSKHLPGETGGTEVFRGTEVEIETETLVLGFLDDECVFASRLKKTRSPGSSSFFGMIRTHLESASTERGILTPVAFRKETYTKPEQSMPDLEEPPYRYRVPR